MIEWSSKDLRTAPQPSWPLLTRGQADLFAPVAFATDQRGRWIELILMFTLRSDRRGARVGKTFALRELLLILDERASGCWTRTHPCP